MLSASSCKGEERDGDERAEPTGRVQGEEQGRPGITQASNGHNIDRQQQQTKGLSTLHAREHHMAPHGYNRRDEQQIARND